MSERKARGERCDHGISIWLSCYECKVYDAKKISEELEKLRAENAAMREALTHTMDFCLCDQIRTKGFDYGEDHKRQGKAQPGQRWKTPRECAREALAKLGDK